MSETKPHNHRGIFVSGTNTNIGKTLCCAALMALLDAAYWKPVQTGPREDHDAPTVHALSGCGAGDIYPSCYSFPEPLSPHEAARRAGGHIDMTQITWPKAADRFMVIEGAGGLLVPLNRESLVIDLIKTLAVPTLIVASSELGTINHTLLSLEAMRARNLPVAGIVLSGPENEANKQAIEYYGQIDVLGHIPLIADVNKKTFHQHLEGLRPLAEKIGPLKETLR